MTKIINNQCDKNGNPYITHLDFLRTIANYDENGKFQYLQSTDGNKYDLKQLSNMKMNFDLKLLDPAYQWNNGSILAKDQNTPKHAEVEINPKSQIKSCINTSKLDDGLISIDTTRHGCDVGKLFNAKNDAFKINLTEGVKANDEFAMLGGTVNLANKGNWIDLGLNEWELSNIRVKITKDCAEEMKKIREEERERQEKLEKEKKEAQEKLEEEIKERDACEPDIAAIRDHRDDVIVKSSQFDGKVGSVNLSCWYFQEKDLYYDLTFDKIGSGRKVGNDNIYLKVIPCNEEHKYYKLALCDQNGNLATKTDGGEAILYMSKCNLIGGQKIQLKDHFREDGLPSFIIKPSESKELGESYGDKSRAEVYEYDPTSDETGGKVGKLNATTIKGYDWGSKTLIADNFLLDSDFKSFVLNKKTTTTVTEKDDLYQLDNTLYPSIGGFYSTHTHAEKSADARTIKLLLDDLLCLFDQSSLQDGIQIIG